MSLSDLPWNHFDPINHFPTGQDSTSGFYPQHPHSTAFFDHGFSQLSNALYHPGNTFFFNMNTLSTAEMERFQKLSNEFQPDVQVRDLMIHVQTIRLTRALEGPSGVYETVQ